MFETYALENVIISLFYVYVKFGWVSNFSVCSVGELCNFYIGWKGGYVTFMWNI